MNSERMVLPRATRELMGGRPRERPSLYISMKTGTEMQTIAKLKSLSNSLLWNCWIYFNHKHWIDLHDTLSHFT